MNIRILILIGILPFFGLLKAQTHLTPDDLFKAARSAAFEEKDEKKAKQLAKQALSIAPRYADLQVFLGRLYSWNKQYDTAVYYFDQVLSYAPENLEASIAYTDLEYWNDHYDKALSQCNKGLVVNPGSGELLLRKAKILNALKQFREASQITDRLLRTNKQNAAALALATSLKDAVAINKIGVSYDYSHFDKQFTQPWHLAGISYSRYTKIGSISANTNYASRFGRNGWQVEVEAYPRISKTFYCYVGVGYSPDESVFPKSRAGFSLYANLPRSYEVEAGIRYLNFGSPTYVYTLYAGKYYNNFLLGARTYVTPRTKGPAHSYNLQGRYYFRGADDYIGISVGSGISPDDRALSTQYINKNRFTSRQASVTFNRSIAKISIISFKLGLLNQEFTNEVTGNQVDFSIGLQRRF